MSDRKQKADLAIAFGTCFSHLLVSYDPIPA